MSDLERIELAIRRAIDRMAQGGGYKDTSQLLYLLEEVAKMNNERKV